MSSTSLTHWMPRQHASDFLLALWQDVAPQPQEESLALGLLVLGLVTIAFLYAFKVTAGYETWADFLRRPVAGLLVGWSLLWLAGAGLLWVQPIPGEVTQVAAAQRPQEEIGREAAVEADLDAEAEDLTPAQRAANIMVANGCGACHTLDGVEGMIGQIGPPLTHVASAAEDRIASPDYTGAATTVEAYIAESILQSDVYIVPDYTATMPANFDQILSEEEVDVLVGFLSSLE